MEYVKLGASGLKVSRLCLGCMTYGAPDRGAHEWTLPEDESRPFIRRALEVGINFFDTSNSYSDGTSEELAGAGAAVWVAGYSNDVFAYLPSKRVLKEGGYEGGGATKYVSHPHPGPFADTVEERIVGKAREVVASLRKPVGK
jgi:hypothetical protein